MLAAYFKRLFNRLYKALSVDNAHNNIIQIHLIFLIELRTCRASLSLLEFLEEYIKGEI